MTGKTRKMQWMAALLLISTAGITMAGPALGPSGPWNRGGGGGGFNGLGPQRCYNSDYQDMGRYGGNFWVSRRPASLITTTIRRAEPVAELTCGSGLAPIAERTTFRQSRLILNEPARRVWTREFREYSRPARTITTTTRTTRFAPVELDAVAEQVTTIRPARRVLMTEQPACGISDNIYR